MGLRPIRKKLSHKGKQKKTGVIFGMFNAQPVEEKDTKSTEHHRESFEFSFSMVTNLLETKDDEFDTEQGYGDRARVSSIPVYQNLCLYEKYLLIKYSQNYHRKKINSFKKDKAEMLIKYIDYIYFMASCDILPLQRRLSPYRTEKLEKVIDKLSVVREMLKQYDGGVDYPMLEIRILAKHSEFVSILEDAVSKGMRIIDDWLEMCAKSDLKKSFYMENLHTYLHLIGATSKTVKAAAEYACLCKNKRAYHRICGDERISSMVDALGLKSFNIQTLKKYNTILFNFMSDRSTNDKMTLELDNWVIEGCFTKHNSKEDLLNYYMPRLKQSDLTKTDFLHVTQYDYLKSILSNALAKHSKGINILIYGKPGGGKTALSRVLIDDVKAEGYEVYSAGKNNKDAVLFKGDSLKNDLRINSFVTMRTMLKNNKNCVILYDEAEDFFRKSDAASQAKATVNDFLEDNENPTIWTTNSLRCMEQSFLRRFTYVLKLDDLPTSVYLDIVNKLCIKYNVSLNDEVYGLIKAYKPNFGIVEKVLKNYILSGSSDFNNIKQDILDSLKGINYGESIEKLAINKFKFNPELLNTSVDLNDLTARLKQNGRLDFSLLLYGVPGSSKTSFGRYLAEELGLSVINKNYADLSSMWVGETEKNIRNLFEQAEAEKALIILDECDVLLRDRGKAMRSWEISQTEALLTCMEFHPYPFIMTTNLYDDLDPAVMRRILYKVKHDYLTDDQVKLAFKYFFDIEITERLNLSRLTSGDFAVVKKQAEFSGYLNDKDLLIEKLTEEMNQKKMLEHVPEIMM